MRRSPDHACRSEPPSVARAATVRSWGGSRRVRPESSDQRKTSGATGGASRMRTSQSPWLPSYPRAPALSPSSWAHVDARQSRKLRACPGRHPALGDDDALPRLEVAGVGDDDCSSRPSSTPWSRTPAGTPKSCTFGCSWQRMASEDLGGRRPGARTDALNDRLRPHLGSITLVDPSPPLALEDCSHSTAGGARRGPGLPPP